MSAPISFDRIENLVIAGWTGRDKAAVEAHIRELAAMGVAAPKATPVFYRVSASLLTTAPAIQVIGKDSSGEVEFVLVKRDGQLWVGAGSDHTDRKAEQVGVTLSKQMCPKPVAPELWLFDEVAPHWDELILRSYAVIEGRRTLYQEGKVSAMRHPRDLMDLYGRFLPNSAMFGGTLPAKGGIRWATTFSFELEDPRLGRKITHTYDVLDLPIAG